VGGGGGNKKDWGKRNRKNQGSKEATEKWASWGQGTTRKEEGGRVDQSTRGLIGSGDQAHTGAHDKKKGCIGMIGD